MSGSILIANADCGMVSYNLVASLTGPGIVGGKYVLRYSEFLVLTAKDCHHVYSRTG